MDKMMKASGIFANIGLGIMGVGVGYLGIECAIFVYKYGAIFFSPQFTGM